MDYVELGKTGLRVSRLAYGTLTMGPLQRDIDETVGSVVIRKALDAGINFIDTAQSYGTYGHVRRALDGFTGDVVIAGKSGAAEYDQMASAVEEAREQMSRDTIEIFLLHALQREEDVKKREGAWQCLLDMKRKGIVKAVGLSTHNLDIVEIASTWPEMDVIHPIFNKLNFGLINVDNKNTETIIRETYKRGIGVYAMKPLAGGHLYKDVVSSLRYVFDFPYLHAVAVGMLTEQELNVNLKIYHNQDVDADELATAGGDKRMFVVRFCKGCGNCLDACTHDALSMVDEKAYIEHSKCVLCGYCRKECPHSMIRII